jgi:hypothetical protein
MAVKIKELGKKSKSSRLCFICGKNKMMTRWQRFCSAVCKSQAADIDRFGGEYVARISKK